MANHDRTEKATGKRRQEARKHGQVAKSQDLSGAGVMIAGLIATIVMAPKIVDAAANAMTQIFGQIARPANVVSGAGLRGLFELVLTTLLHTVVPIALVCMATGVALNVIQIGFRLSPQAIIPNFQRISPISGAKNLFGKRALFETGKALVKFALVGGLVALALIPDITRLGANVGTPPAALGHLMQSGVKGIAFRAAAGYLLIGIVDYFWQRRRFEDSLKMTKQEVKEEAKQYQLPPEVRGAIRRRQVQQARARMMAAVPNADVVITNPTHYAVALEYSGEQPAPVVIAKGMDHVALQIRRIAEEHGIEIVSDPPLARELHRTVELDQMIPAELYAAVAQVLAFVYRLAARRRRGAV